MPADVTNKGMLSQLKDINALRHLADATRVQASPIHAKDSGASS